MAIANNSGGTNRGNVDRGGGVVRPHFVAALGGLNTIITRGGQHGDTHDTELLEFNIGPGDVVLRVPVVGGAVTVDSALLALVPSVRHGVNKRGLVGVQDLVSELVHPVVHDPERGVSTIAEPSQALDIKGSLSVSVRVGVAASVVTNDVGDGLDNQVVDLLELLQIVGTETFGLVTDLGVGSLRSTLGGDIKVLIDGVHALHGVRDVAPEGSASTRLISPDTLGDGSELDNTGDKVNNIIKSLGDGESTDVLDPQLVPEVTTGPLEGSQVGLEQLLDNSDGGGDLEGIMPVLNGKRVSLGSNGLVDSCKKGKRRLERITNKARKQQKQTLDPVQDSLASLGGALGHLVNLLGGQKFTVQLMSGVGDLPEEVLELLQVLLLQQDGEGNGGGEPLVISEHVDTLIGVRNRVPVEEVRKIVTNKQGQQQQQKKKG